MMMTPDGSDVVVLGLGPAGLIATHSLACRGRSVIAVERQGRVGGLSASIEFAGAKVDLGPHFFACGVAELEPLRRDLLGDDEIFLTQRTRMFWRDTLLGYPPGLADLVHSVGFVESIRIGLSFLAAAPRRSRPAGDYAAQARSTFGRRFFETCLRGYVEKLWGVPCEAIEPGWEPGRIRSVTLPSLARQLVSHRNNDATMSVPRHGTGQFYDAMAQSAAHHGAELCLEHDVCDLIADGDRVNGVVVMNRATGERRTIPCTDVISTIPLTTLADKLGIAPRRASDHSPAYRSTVLVYLQVDAGELFADQSIYVNDASLSVGRVANFSNFGAAMHQTPGQSVLCAELWCDQHDETWSSSDSDLRERVIDDLTRMGILTGQEIVDHHIIRLPNTHPVPEIATTPIVSRLRRDIDQFRNVHAVGRAGAFVYSDMDAVLIAGIAAAEAVVELGG